MRYEHREDCEGNGLVVLEIQFPMSKCVDVCECKVWMLSVNVKFDWSQRHSEIHHFMEKCDVQSMKCEV